MHAQHGEVVHDNHGPVAQLLVARAQTAADPLNNVGREDTLLEAVAPERETAQGAEDDLLYRAVEGVHSVGEGGEELGHGLDLRLGNVWR